MVAGVHQVCKSGASPDGILIELCILRKRMSKGTHSLSFFRKEGTMNNYLFISDAAKEVKVESHVLRYWEEELHLPIKRNELGHRYYTQEDVERFKQIKGMKERGLQLKAIRMILRDGKLDMLPDENVAERGDGKQEATEDAMGRAVMQDARFAGMGIEIVEQRSLDAEGDREGNSALSADFKEDKARRLQWLLQEMIRQTIRETNQELSREIRDSVVKELDYQFRMQEEREEAREKRLEERDEEYYKRMDELLRKKSRGVKRPESKKKEEKKEDTLEAQLQKEVESILAGQSVNEGTPARTRERSAEAVEEAIREKSLKHKKKHFF